MSGLLEELEAERQALLAELLRERNDGAWWARRVEEQAR